MYMRVFVGLVLRELP